MMNGKNHNVGFTLIEAVVAVAVLGIIVTSVFSLLQVSIQGDVRGASRVQRILLLKNELSNPELFKDETGAPPAENQKVEQKSSTREVMIKEPKTRIIITQNAAVEGPLAAYKHLIRANAQARWDLLRFAQDEHLTLYHCAIPAVRKDKRHP